MFFPPPACAADVGRAISRDIVEPAGEVAIAGKFARLLCEQEKDGLRDVLGLFARQPAGGRLNHAAMTADDLGKCVAVTRRRVMMKKLAIGHTCPFSGM